MALVNQVSAGHSMPVFLVLILSANICVLVCLRVCVCVCVCPLPRLLMTSGGMWCDIDPIKLVKYVLWLLYGNCCWYR